MIQFSKFAKENGRVGGYLGITGSVAMTSVPVNHSPMKTAAVGPGTGTANTLAGLCLVVVVENYDLFVEQISLRGL